MAPQVPNSPSSIGQRWRAALVTTGGAAIALFIVVVLLSGSQPTSATTQVAADRPVTDARVAVVVAEEHVSDPQVSDSDTSDSQAVAPGDQADPVDPSFQLTATVSDQTPISGPTDAAATSTATETPQPTTTATPVAATATPTLTPVADQLFQVDPGVVASVAPAATSDGGSFAIPDMNQSQNFFNSLDPSRVTLLPTSNVPANGTNRPLPFPTAAVGTPVIAP